MYSSRTISTATARLKKIKSKHKSTLKDEEEIYFIDKNVHYKRSRTQKYKDKLKSLLSGRVGCKLDCGLRGDLRLDGK